MKNFKNIFCFLLLFQINQVFSQSILIDSLQEGGFSLGSTFADNGWTVLNGTAANAWYVGTTPGVMTGNCAYISNNSGASWAYTNNTTSRTVHFYKNVVLPQGINYLELSFSWVNVGEVAPNDVLMVSIAPTTYTPSQSNTTAIILGKPAETLTILNNQGTVKRQRIYFSPQVINTCTASDSFRLIFSYRYNSSLGSNPPAAIDDISLILHSSPISNSGGEFSVDMSKPDGPFNFSSLSKAIVASNAASQCLMTDSIVLNIPGDQVFLEDLPWITFKGSANASLKIRQSTVGNRPIVRPFGSSWNRDFGIGLSGASYVHIENIDVRVDPANNNVEYGYFIKPEDAVKGSQYNKFIDASIVLNKNNTNSFGILQTTNSAVIGFSVSAQSGSNSWNEYKGIKIQNTAQGVSLQGASTTYYDEGNKMGSSVGEQMIIGGESANDIGGTFEVSGIQVYFQKNLNIDGAVVRNIFTNGAFGLYGIRIVDCAGTIVLNRNSVNRLTNIATTTYGFLAGVFTSGSAASTVYKLTNNFISDLTTMYMSGNNTQFVTGCYLNHTNSTNYIYYNSIVIAPSSNLSSVAMYSVLGQTYLKNNILINNSYGNNNLNHRYSLHLGSSTLTESNYNCLKTDLSGLNSFLVKSSGGINYSNLSAWQTASGKDLNSLELNPDFVSSNDLHIQSTSFKIDRKGTHVPGVNYDFDGMLRDTVSPDIGADDHMPISNGIDIGVYDITGIDNFECFGMNEQVSVRLINTGISEHDFSIYPVEIQLTYTGTYSGMVNLTINDGTLNSYDDTIVLIPNIFDFSGGGTITFNCNLLIQSDINLSNNIYLKVVSQEVVYQNVVQNFNQLSSLPAGWIFDTGWSISTPPGSLSKCLYKVIPTNSTSQIILPLYGTVTAQDSFSFDLKTINSGSWDYIIIELSTNCGYSYIQFDTLYFSQYSNQSLWHHYSRSLSEYEGNNVKFRIKIRSIGLVSMAFDNFNVACCVPPQHPISLELISLNYSSVGVSFPSSGSDGYLVVRYPSDTIPNTFPQNGSIYTLNNMMGNGFIVSYGPSLSFNVSGLNEETSYDFYVFPYNAINCASGPTYNITNPMWGTVTTPSCVATGVLKIGSSNSDFNSINSALLYVNSVGVKDTVYLELQPDYLPESKIIFNSIGCADSADVVIIRPSEDVSSEINFTTPTGVYGPILEFNVTSGVIIDGRPGGTGLLNYLKFSPSLGTTVNFHPGSKFIKLKNLNIVGNQALSNDGVVDLYSAYRITIENCNIGNSNQFLPTLLMCNYCNNLTLKDNNFFNFSDFGVKLETPKSSLIDGNSFYFTMPFNGSGVSITAIEGTVDDNSIVTNNWIGGSNTRCQGGKMILNNTSSSNNYGNYFTGIEVRGLMNNDLIKHNNIQNIKVFSGFGTGEFHAIKTTASVRFIESNVIGGLSDTSSIVIEMPNSLRSFNFYAISFKSSYLLTNPTVSILRNRISNVVCDGTNSMDFNFNGIYFKADDATPISYVDSNEIFNIRSNAYGLNYGINCLKNVSSPNYTEINSISGNIIDSLNFSTAAFTGIYHFTTNYFTRLNNNVVSNILAGDSTLNTSATRVALKGIQAVGKVTVENNWVYDLQYKSQWNRGAEVRGIEMYYNPSPVGLFSGQNNIIYRLSNTSSSENSKIVGLFVGGSISLLYNNRVFINADSSPIAKIYGIFTNSGHRTIHNNSIAIKGFRGNNNIVAPIFIDGAVNLCSISNNILVNKCNSPTNNRLYYCIAGNSSASKFENLQLGSNIYNYNYSNGGICMFPLLKTNDMIHHSMIFSMDSTSFSIDPLIDFDSGPLIPLKGSFVEGAGFNQQIAYDCFNNERNLLSPHDIGAVAGNFYNDSLDLSIKSRVRQLGCDSVQVFTHIKNNSNVQVDFSETEAVIEIINEGLDNSVNYNFSLTSGILEPLEEDTIAFSLPLLSNRDSVNLLTKILFPYDTRAINNVHMAAYEVYLPGTFIMVGKDGDFSSLTEAAFCFNTSNCLDQNVTFVLSDTLYDERSEYFPITFDRSNLLSSVNLRIIPKNGTKVKIQSLTNLNSPLILFKSADKIDFNGIDTVGNTTLSLISSSLNQPCIHLSGNLEQIKMSNLAVKGMNQTNLGLIYMDKITSDTSMFYINRCNIEPFSSTNVPYAISLSITTNRNNGFMEISNCSLKNYLNSGIYSPNGTWDSIFILSNYFESSIAKSTTLQPIHLNYAGRLRAVNNFIGNHRTTGIYRGIYINEITNALISKNLIINASNPGTSNNLTGIHMEFMPNLICDNNMISLNWTGTQSSAVQAIYCNIAQSCSIINNTVLISGTITNTILSSALSINRTNTLGYLRNNLLFNNTTTSNGQRTSFRYNIPTNLDSDYNIFIGKGSTPQNIFFHNGVYYDIVGWRAQPFQPDIHSYAHIIGDAGGGLLSDYFQSPNNLHLVTGVNNAKNNGIPLPGFNTDIDNNVRSSQGVDIGADEISDSCSIGFQPIVSLPDSFFCNGDEAIVFSDASISSQMGQNYKWQYSLKLNGPFQDIINTTYNFDSLLWKVNLADTIYLRLFSGCSFSGLDTFSNTVSVYRQSNLVFAQLDSVYGSLRKGIECAEFGDTLWIDPVLDTIQLASQVLFEKKVTVVDELSPYVKVLNQIQNIAVEQILDIGRSGNVSFKGMQFEGGGNFYPIINNAGNLSLYNVILKNNLQKIKNHPYSKILIEGLVEILD